MGFVAEFDFEFNVRLVLCCSVDPTNRHELHQQDLHTRLYTSQMLKVVGRQRGDLRKDVREKLEL